VTTTIVRIVQLVARRYPLELELSLLGREGGFGRVRIGDLLETMIVCIKIVSLIFEFVL
jgi:hypothetical protein